MLYKDGKTGKFIKQSEALEILKSLKRPSDFGYHGNLPVFETWALGTIIETRDSTLLDQSNASEIVKRLESHKEFENRWSVSNCSHWACGWVDHLSYQVILSQTDNVITFDPIVWFIQDIYRQLEDYPILNEEDYSNREYESTLENIRDSVRYFERKTDQNINLPDDYEHKLFNWFWDNDQRAVENTDDQGGYPSDDQLTTAFESLGWIVPD